MTYGRGLPHRSDDGREGTDDSDWLGYVGTRSRSRVAFARGLRRSWARYRFNGRTNVRAALNTLFPGCYCENKVFSPVSMLTRPDGCLGREPVTWRPHFTDILSFKVAATVPSSPQILRLYALITRRDWFLHLVKANTSWILARPRGAT